MSFLLGSNHVHDSGDLHELRLSEFAKDGLKLGPLYETCQLEVVLSAVLKVAVSVAGVLDQVPCPDALLRGSTAVRVG